MIRIKLTVEYDGSGFVGWQRQDNGPSVQAALERALAAFCGQGVAVTGAGRTDAGVHASGQVAHVDLDREWPQRTICAAANFHLKPLPVAVLRAERVAEDFHARFSARQRAYRYRILSRPAPPVLDRGQVWWVPGPLDVGAMAAAAALLVGRHDFGAFRSAACQAYSALKTLDSISVHRRGEEVVIDVRARSFLHNQVRIIAGTLKRIGEAGMSAHDVATALRTGERRHAGPTAPPSGLCLRWVGYGDASGQPRAGSSVETVGDRADDEAEGDVDGDDAGGGQPAQLQPRARHEPDVDQDRADRGEPQQLVEPGRQQARQGQRR
jgi:tRNA pseudouridine38-40 synthase